MENKPLTTVHRYRKSLVMKPFPVLKKQYKTLEQRENRLWFCEYLKDCDEDDYRRVLFVLTKFFV